MPPKRRAEKKPRALLRERLYVPREYVTDDILAAWTYYVPDPDDADNKIQLDLYKEVKNGRILSFAPGDMAKVRKHFGPDDFDLIDKRVAPPMDHPVSMRSELYTPCHQGRVTRRRSV